MIGEENDYKLFKTYEGKDLAKWKELVGQKVQHSSKGSGRIISVTKPTILRLSIVYYSAPNTLHQYAPAAFVKVLRLVLSQELRGKVYAGAGEVECKKLETEAQLTEQREAAKDFERLKQKYKLTDFVDPSPLSPLYRILLELEQTQEISREDQDWLVSTGLGVFVARYLEDHYKQSGDGWDLVRASSLWRDAEIPQKALHATSGFSTNNPQLMAAINVTRGAAFRDIGKLDEAERCGREALRINPECGKYAYNLMGAVCYGKGVPKEGDRYFAKAGTSDISQDRAVRKVLDVADEDARQSVARYLLNKDPVRYKWAEHYLKGSAS